MAEGITGIWRYVLQRWAISGDMGIRMCTEVSYGDSWHKEAIEGWATSGNIMGIERNTS